MLLACIGYHFAGPGEKPFVANSALKSALPPTTTLTNPVEVFQRAFWKRPTANDTILHAERREWKDEDGVKKWQWFIAVRPSPELVKHLRTDNAFNLVPGKEPQAVEHAPDWFVIKPGAVDVLKASMGGMQLMFSRKDNILYATDTGGGFHTGAPEVQRPVPVQVATGRLPPTPPPNPNTP